MRLADGLDGKDLEAAAKHQSAHVSQSQRSLQLQSVDSYRTVIDRPRSICASSGETMPDSEGGPRCRKWCFRPGTRDERISNHFADKRVKMTPLVGMPFYNVFVRICR